MAQRRFHYDAAFEHYLRSKGIPYVAVDEAKRALQGRTVPSKLKSFDFVVYSKGEQNLLIDVKGRKHSGKTGSSLQNWVTAEDVDSLAKWAEIFGDDFIGAFAFLYWCDAQPPDALFFEVFEFGDKWYAVLAVTLEDYRLHMKQRSPKWGTVSLPAAAFNAVSRSLDKLL